VYRPRVVADTNVFVSALLWPGIPNRILKAAEKAELVLVTCPGLLAELQEVLVRPAFVARMAELHTSIAELTESLLSTVDVIPDPSIEPIIARDPDDDLILACAAASHAHWIVSGDLDLRDLKHFREIPIMTPRQFWDAWVRRRT
jgi:putative PIN family toxin of toxin-antitoxin system